MQAVYFRAINDTRERNTLCIFQKMQWADPENKCTCSTDGQLGNRKVKGLKKLKIQDIRRLKVN